MSDFDFRIDARDIEKAAKNMSHVETILTEEMRQSMNESLAYAEDFLAKYPPKPVGFHMIFKSAKQRRKVFALIREGLIPYKRTGKLGQGWTTNVRVMVTSIRGVLGNIRPYARLVQDELKQARVHRGRWPTVQMLKRTPAKKIERFFRNGLRRVVDRLRKL